MRLRQAVASIEVRQYAAERKAHGLVSWQTRQLAQYIAAGYMVEGENPMFRAAGLIGFDDIERGQLQEASERDEKAETSKVWTPDMPSESPVNKTGSFERFMSKAAKK